MIKKTIKPFRRYVKLDALRQVGMDGYTMTFWLFGFIPIYKSEYITNSWESWI